MKPLITYDQFAVLDLRVGKIKKCEEKEGSDKLLRLTVDFGEEGIKTILSGIKAWYRPEELLGRSFIFVANLKPRKLMDEMSEGMILATDGETPYMLQPIGETTPGTTIR